MQMSPIDTSSRETNPLKLPEPYRISKEVPLAEYVEEDDESYLLWRKHAIEPHWVEGTQTRDNQFETS